MRRRDPDLSLDSQKGGGKLTPPFALAFDTAGGRQKLQCWNTQGIFRLIQSIPSRRVGPSSAGQAGVCGKAVWRLTWPVLQVFL